MRLIARSGLCAFGFALALALVAGCSSNDTGNSDAGVPDLSPRPPDLSVLQDLAQIPDLIHPGDGPYVQYCVMPSDCRLFSSYCKGCNCLALTATDHDPECAAKDLVSCTIDPCSGHTVACMQNTCVAQ